MIDPMHFDRVSHGDVVKKWGVPANKLGDVLALAGDSSDNIPGAPGIGPKIAARLIEEYGNLEVLIQHADNIKQKKRKESLVENADKVKKMITFNNLVSYLIINSHLNLIFTSSDTLVSQVGHIR